MSFLKNFFTIIYSILIIFFILELVLRFMGNKPRIDNLGRSDDPVIYKKDDELGWLHKPGSYLFQPWSNEGKITTFTINQDGSRKIENQSSIGKKILFFGGSLTQGWAVDDNENFVNYFQDLNENLKVFNFGVGGYGGYQSLILQERIIKRLDNVSHIIYGFIDHHEVRNVAAGSWLYMLNEYSKRGHIMVPYGSTDNGKLKRNKPVNYIKLPISEYSALIAKVEKRIMKLKSSNREEKQFEISKLIIEKMFENSSKHNSKFSVLLLDIKQESLVKYVEFFNTKNINFINCQFPGDQNIKGEGHPNAIAHKVVAKCLNEKF